MSALRRDIPILDDLLSAHAADLGEDFAGYRNHAYRVANFCAAQLPADGERWEKIAIAAAFHDLGIWTHGTFDYLPPSIDLACAHLVAAGKPEWTAEMTDTIREHHRISARADRAQWLVEPFRRADWIDVSRGALSFGLPRALVRDVLCEWPNAGFHKRLAKLTVRRLCTHPFSPLPMLKW